MPFRELQENILDAALCTACGVCQLACPQDMIEFDGLQPRLRDDFTSQDCSDCQDCLSVCPGLDPGTPDAETRQFGRRRREDERWLGICRTISGARSSDPEVVERSASGGSVTTLLIVALRYLELDGILTMGRSDEQPWRSMPEICRSPEEIQQAAQSTYQLAPYLGHVRDALQGGERLGMVGLACHVQGLRKLQSLDTELGRRAREQIVFSVEIACSSGTNPTGTETLITELMGLDLHDVVSIRYREGKYPGQVQVCTRQGEEHLVPFWLAVRHFASHKSHRCLACGDWMSGLADISVSDGDPNIYDASLGLHSIEKHGRVFLRTDVGERVFQQAVHGGALEAWPISLTGENLGLERKRNRRKTYECNGKPIPLAPIPGFRESGEIVPDQEFLDNPLRDCRCKDVLGPSLVPLEYDGVGT